jgi:putative SOS response-associated peptidase YedK
MCTNYRPTARDLIAQRLHVADPGFDWEAEVWPGHAAPLLRVRDGQRELVKACFGLVPHWAPDTKIARMTYNARSETVAEKPSYRQPWARRQFGLVPMDAFYEPNYESGKAVRWRIERADGAPFLVAALWDRWVARPTGEIVWSFSMLTINADGHPLMARFHKPGDEKRSLVIVDSGRADAWLRAADGDAARALLQPFDAAAFTTRAEPLPPRARARA